MRLHGPGQASRCLAAGSTAAAAIIITACGGGGPAKPSPAATTPSGGAAPTAGAAAQNAISTTWQEFFNAKTPTSRRVVLLQNGPTFQQALASQAKLPVASAATAKVSKVAVTGPGTARVTYTILASGTPVLSNQTGTAVYSGGTWKVGMASYCQLLVLQNGGSTSSLPAACKSGG